MRALSAALIVLAGLINLAPVLGAFSVERMQSLYGVALQDANLGILMRHRAVLFGIVGAIMLASAFHPPLRPVAYAAGFLSMLSFLAIAWLVGGYNAEIQRVCMIDGVGLAALLGAWLIDRFVAAT
jgi:hypothetical protein